MSTYKAQTPSPSSHNGLTVPAKVVSFYSNFYSVSDDPSTSAHSSYVNAFTPDATLIMGTRTAAGHEELMTLRKGLWSGPIKTRLHTVRKIFPWDSRGTEIMLYGEVKYGLVNGKEVVVQWAGRAELEGVEEEGKEVKMKFYQVYLDSAPVANAMKES